MQVKGFQGFWDVCLRRFSYFTTRSASKKRKTGNVERLFLRCRKRMKRAIENMRASSTAIAVVLILTTLLPFCMPRRAEDAKELPSMVSSVTLPQSEAQVPLEKPAGTFSDAECVSVFYVTGDTGEEVLALERALETLGYDTGNADGIYSSKTAAALRRFQSDRGLKADGVCTEALYRTAVTLAGSGHVRDKTVSEGLLADALYRVGCMTEADARASMQNRQLLRDALIFFQRSRGLNGVGESNYATLCALGLGSVFVYEENEENDLQMYLIASYLARFSVCYPEEADLYTLICVASSLYNRAQLLGTGDPMLSVVCSAPIEGEKNTVGNAKAPNALCLRAAEDALSRLSQGADPVRGASEYCHTSCYEAYAKKVQNDTGKEPEITRRVGKLYFFK